MFHFSSSFMLAVRQRLLSLVGLEPTRSPLQEDLNRLRNDTSKPSSEPWHGLGPRQQTAYISTCGYLDGDSDKSRTPDPGFDCRVDTVNDLWGFCPTTVISASDCGLAAKCIDAFACSSGCGIPKVAGLATLAWYGICYFLFYFWVLSDPCLDPSLPCAGFVFTIQKRKKTPVS